MKFNFFSKESPGPEKQEVVGAVRSFKTNRSLEEYERDLQLKESDLDNKRVLDLGSGPRARFAKEVEEKYPGTKVVSLDYSFEEPPPEDPRYLLKGDENFSDRNVDKVVGFATTLPFADSSFDTIVSSGAIPFYLLQPEQIEKVFKEIIRVLKVGGKGYFHPVKYTKHIEESRPGEFVRREQYGYEETKKMLENIFKKFKKGIKFEFSPPITSMDGERVKKEGTLTIIKISP